MGIKRIIILILSGIILYSQEEGYYVNIKNPTEIPHTQKARKNLRSATQKDKVNEENNKEKEPIYYEVSEKDDCEIYKIVNAYKCKDCFNFILENQKQWHNSTHKLEEIKL